MRFRILLSIVAGILLTTATSASAQFSGESETGTDAKGGAFVSQYVFYDRPTTNVLVRYFWVNGKVDRAEFGFGPTVKLGRVTWKTQFGIDTGREIKVAGTVLAKVADRQLIYIYDINASTRPAVDQGWIYQKFFAGIDQKSVWQFRAESLTIAHQTVFLRLGGEYQIQFHPKRHFYIAPFYDPIVGSPGGQVGFRFFNQTKSAPEGGRN